MRAIFSPIHMSFEDQDDTDSQKINVPTAAHLNALIASKEKEFKNDHPHLREQISLVAFDLRSQVSTLFQSPEPSEPSWKEIKRLEKAIGNICRSAEKAKKNDGKEDRRNSARDKVYSAEDRRRMSQEAQNPSFA